jgi:hypothetical protein
MAAYSDVLNLINSLLASGTDITATEHRQVEIALLDFAESQWLTGDIKEIDCTDAYIAANFESTGPNKGRGIIGTEREGWAICNGYNGTRNRTGRVSVAWGDVTPLGTAGDATTQPLIGATINAPVISGKKDHVLSVNELPAHNHVFPGDDQLAGANNIGGWTNRTTANFNYDANSGGGGGKIYRTSDTGTGTAHNNMQPYIVTLFIQKL